MQGSARLRLRIAATVAIAAAALAVGGVATVVRTSAPSMGVAIAAGGDRVRDGGLEVERLPGITAAPFQPGDRVVSIAGRSLADWAGTSFVGYRPGADTLDVRTGDGVAVGIIRAGVPVELSVPLLSFPAVAMAASNLGTLGFCLVLAGVAAFVFWRRPGSPAAGGLLIAGAGALGSSVPFLLGLEPLDLATGRFLPYAAATNLVYLLLWLGAMHFALTFPRSLPIAARPRTLPLLYLGTFGGYALALLVGRALAPDDLAWLASWVAVQYVVIVATFVVSGWASWQQYRRASLDDRRMLRGVGLATAFALVGSIAIWLAPEIIFGQPLVPWSVAGLVGLPVPIALAGAILRHKAFDIEVFVRRSLVYGMLTVLIVLVYAGSVTLLGIALRPDSYAPSLLATGIAALAALPLRDALQRSATRLLFGDRDDPGRALARLGNRLEWALDPTATPGIIVQTVAESLRLPYAAIRVGPPGSDRLEASHGAPTTWAPIALPLVYGSEPVGELIIAPRSADEPFSAADLRLLEGLSRQAGAAIHAVRLTLDLVRSRQDLVSAREEERRRLRRDLHDGLGPTLAAIALRAEAAGDMAKREPEAAEVLLGDLRTEVGGALAEIRRLVDELRPPALDELGLVGAIRQQAQRLGPLGLDRRVVGPDVEVDAPERLPTLPAAIEVAAYRIAVEAVTNAVRHSGGTHCQVRLRSDDGLSLEVVDDGRGLPDPVRPGIGLGSMRERAAEVGGQWGVEPGVGGGTRVWARLPLTGMEA